MKLLEIFQNLESGKSSKIDKALESFYDTVMKYVHGNVEDQHKAYYLQVFYKNFQYGNFNQCIEIIENADTEVKNLVPSMLWKHCEQYRQKNLSTFPGNGNKK